MTISKDYSIQLFSVLMVIRFSLHKKRHRDDGAQDQEITGPTGLGKWKLEIFQIKLLTHVR